MCKFLIIYSHMNYYSLNYIGVKSLPLRTRKIWKAVTISNKYLPILKTSINTVIILEQFTIINI